MKSLTRNEWIAVAAGLGLMVVLFFGGAFMNLFYPAPNTETVMNNESQGVAMEDVVVGSGEVAEAGDTVTVHYVGTLTNGKVFDSSVDRNDPFVFSLGEGQVIRGWDEGVVGMQVGGKRRLTISPEYAYGNRAVGPIPPNSTLVFEVELLDVEKGR